MSRLVRMHTCVCAGVCTHVRANAPLGGRALGRALAYIKGMLRSPWAPQELEMCGKCGLSVLCRITV